MLGRFGPDTAGKRQALDSQTLYGAARLQDRAVRGQAWTALPQDPEPQLRAAQNTDNMAPFHVVSQAAPLNAQRGLLGRLRSGYTFLPVGAAYRAPQSSA